jgi:hypothetical protein
LIHHLLIINDESIDIVLNIDNKKASKISLITDSSKFIYSILSIKINKSEIKIIDKRKKQNKKLKKKD